MNVLEAPLSASITTAPIVNLDTQAGINMYAKLECNNPTGSFKERGAAHMLNVVLEEEPELLKSGVITASAGNHAQGVARAARELGVEANVFVPINTPLRKIEAILNFGAKLTISGECFDQTLEAALVVSETEKKLFVHPFDDRRVIEGQAQVGAEIAEDDRNYDRVFVPVGGGGLLAGVISALKSKSPSTQVYGVQLEGSDSFSKSYEAKKQTTLDTVNTLSDGTAVKTAGKLALEIAWNARQFAGCITVSTAELACAVVEQDILLGIEAETAGCLAFAGMRKLRATRYEDEYKDENWVGIVSGIHRDPELCRRLQAQ